MKFHIARKITLTTEISSVEEVAIVLRFLQTFQLVHSVVCQCDKSESSPDLQIDSPVNQQAEDQVTSESLLPKPPYDIIQFKENPKRLPGIYFGYLRQQQHSSSISLHISHATCQPALPDSHETSVGQGQHRTC